MRDLAVDGFAVDEFAPLADIFAREITRMPSGGAALTVIRGDAVVADLRGGDYVAGPSRQLLFSVSKVITAAAGLHAVANGIVDLDEPIAGLWPEFGRAGTESITLRMILAHRSGIIGVSRDLPFEALVTGGYEAELASRAEPAWEPGTDHGYHAWSFGALVDGILRRAGAPGVARWIETVLNPAADSALTLGVAPDAASFAPLIVEDLVPTPLQSAWAVDERRCGDALARGALSDIQIFNEPALIAAGWPASNVVGTATDVARAAAAIIGGELLSSDTLASMTTATSDGLDRVLGIRSAYGLGVQLPSTHLPFLGPGSFGHEGAGGALVAASVSRRLSIGFATNRLAGVKGASDAIQALLPAIRHCSDEGNPH